MSATRRRLLIAVPIVLVCAGIGYLAFDMYSHLARERTRQKFEDKLGKRVFVITRALREDVLNRWPDDPIRDYKGTDRESCMNSWRMMFTYLHQGYPETLDGTDPRPDPNECWQIQVRWGYYGRWSPFFFCPSHQETTLSTKDFTEIMAIVGPNAPFTEFMDGQRIKYIKDLPDNALLLLEVPDSKTHWMEAGDMQISELEAAANRNEKLGTGASPYGRWVAFANTTTWLLDKETPIAALLPFCTIEGAKKHDRNEVLGKYLIHEFVAW